MVLAQAGNFLRKSVNRTPLPLKINKGYDETKYGYYSRPTGPCSTHSCKINGNGNKIAGLT